MIVLGITGTIGAGKGTIVDYLIKEKCYAHFSVRAYLQKEMLKRGMPNNRDSMVSLANQLRSQNSPSYVTDQLYSEALQSGKNCIIESIRTPGEIMALQKNGNFYLIAVDAQSATRYHRIKLRASATDHISYETFLANEAREMNNTDPNKQNLKKCIQMADFSIDNNGDRIQLIHQTEKIIEKL